jgi:hypothetical protein
MSDFIDFARGVLIPLVLSGNGAGLEGLNNMIAQDNAFYLNVFQILNDYQQFKEFISATIEIGVKVHYNHLFYFYQHAPVSDALYFMLICEALEIKRPRINFKAQMLRATPHESITAEIVAYVAKHDLKFESMDMECQVLLNNYQTLIMAVANIQVILLPLELVKMLKQYLL